MSRYSTSVCTHTATQAFVYHCGVWVYVYVSVCVHVCVCRILRQTRPRMHTHAWIHVTHNLIKQKCWHDRSELLSEITKIKQTTAVSRSFRSSTVQGREGEKGREKGGEERDEDSWRRAVVWQLINNKINIFAVMKSQSRNYWPHSNEDVATFLFFPYIQDEQVQYLWISFGGIDDQTNSPSLWTNSHLEQIIFPEFCCNSYFIFPPEILSRFSKENFDFFWRIDNFLGTHYSTAIWKNSFCVNWMLNKFLFIWSIIDFLETEDSQ